MDLRDETENMEILLALIVRRFASCTQQRMQSEPDVVEVEQRQILSPTTTGFPYILHSEKDGQVAYKEKQCSL